MVGRIRVITTEAGMKMFGTGQPQYGYAISRKGDSLFVLRDDRKSIVSYAINFWKPYHFEESEAFNKLNEH